MQNHLRPTTLFRLGLVTLQCVRLGYVTLCLDTLQLVPLGLDRVCSIGHFPMNIFIKILCLLIRRLTLQETDQGTQTPASTQEIQTPESSDQGTQTPVSTDQGTQIPVSTDYQTQTVLQPPFKCLTLGVVTRGLLPPMAPGWIDPVSL